MSITILIVDDEPNMARPVERVLRRHGCEPVICSTIDEAREYIQESPPDLIILDIMFPESERAGIAFLADLKNEKNPVRNIPVVMLTVLGDSEIERECLRLGAATYIRKRAVTKEIIGIVEKALGLKKGSLKPIRLFASFHNIMRMLTGEVVGHVPNTTD